MKNSFKVPLARSVILPLVCLSLAACQETESTPAAAPAPVEVGVVDVQPQDVVLTTELPGRTTAYLVAEVRPQVTGILLNRLFEEGREVEAGQVLYEIDPASYRATLESAQASLESSKALAKRYERLIKTHAISRQEYDDAQSRYLQDKAAVTSAGIDLGYTKIKAPISGRIGRSSVTQGALLTANQPEALATIQQLDPIYVDIVQSSTAMLQLKDDLASGRLSRDEEGWAQVNLRLENGKRYPHPGKLQFSEVSVDEGTGAVTMRAIFPNPDGLLLPGMFVRTQLQEGVRKQALLVPQRGITRDSRGQATALVVGPESKVQLRQVHVERPVGDKWLVNEGLQAGDRLIVDGVQRIREGVEVRAVDADVATAAGSAPSGPIPAAH